MEYWEFLIQKEGNRAWLPIKSNKPAIEAGKYRIVAQTSRKQADVEVRVSYQAPQAPEQKRRSQKRLRRTNTEGLMVVIPYTFLQPGVWAIHCTGDILSEFLGESWQESLQLNVLAPQKRPIPEPSQTQAQTNPIADNPENVETDIAISDPDAPISTSAAEVTVSSDSSDKQPEQISSDNLEPEPEGDPQALATSGAPAPNFHHEPTQGLPTPSTPLLLPPCAPTLTLEESTITWDRGKNIAVSGQINAPQANSTYFLVYQLRNPQTWAIVFSTQQQLSTPSLPMNFRHTLAIPEEHYQPLLLGEILLFEGLPEEQNQQAAHALVSQSFSIMASVGQLWQSASTPEENIVIPEVEKPPVKLNFDLLNLTNQPKADAPQFEPLDSDAIPPLIRNNPPAQTPLSVNLPAVSDSQQQSSPDAQPIPVDGELLLTQASLAQDEFALASSQDTPYKVNKPEAIEALVVLEDESQAPGREIQDEITQSFQALRLNKRFLSMLTTLAQDSQLKQLLNHTQEPAASYVSTATLDPVHNILTYADHREQEIVVEDGLRENISAPLTGLNTSGLPYPKELLPSSTQPPSLSPEQLARVIPVPTLTVTKGELTAGKNVFVRVKLPSGLDDVYVKLWVLDCQTRHLLDGPRNLVDFTPNRYGERETITQVNVPLGSLEIRFEAIAVDRETQQESYKATVNRAVIPPDLPPISLEEFDYAYPQNLNDE